MTTLPQFISFHVGHIPNDTLDHCYEQKLIIN